MRSAFAVVLLLTIVFHAAADMKVVSGFGGRNCDMNTVDNLGHAIQLYRVGELDIVGTRVPLFAYWTSAEDTRSSVFGYGWHIPWLECCMIPRDERSYEQLGVYGERTRFFRDKNSKDRFRSRYNRWAVVRKDEIRVYNSEKIEKEPDMVFRAGRLVQFRYRSKNVKLEYVNGLFSRMSVDGHKMLSVEKSGGMQGSFRLVFGPGTVTMTDFVRAPAEICLGFKDGKPIKDWGETLISLKTCAGESMSFFYGVEKTGMARMSDGRQMVTWDPSSRLIRTIDDWAYNITDIDPDRHNAHYYRKRANGEVEEFYMDWKTGVRIRDLRGCRETARLFTSGKFRGMLRWKERRIPGGFGERSEFSYNENGVLMYYKLVNLNDMTYTETWNDDTGRIAKSRLNGDDKTVCEYVFTPNGERVVVRSDGKIVHRGVSNAEEFVKWREDIKKGLKVPPPKKPESPPLPVLDVSKGVLGRRKVET